MLARRTVQGIVFGLVVGGVLVTGCKKPQEKAPLPPAEGQPQPALPTASTPAPAPSTTVTPTLAGTAGPTSLPTLLPDSHTLTTTTPGPASPTDAKALLAETNANVAAKKWDAAADDLKKLNAMKGQLSPDLKDAVTAADANFAAAKTGSGLKLPGLGGPTTAPATITPVEPNK